MLRGLCDEHAPHFCAPGYAVCQHRHHSITALLFAKPMAMASLSHFPRHLRNESNLTLSQNIQKDTMNSSKKPSSSENEQDGAIVLDAADTASTADTIGANNNSTVVIDCPDGKTPPFVLLQTRHPKKSIKKSISISNGISLSQKLPSSAGV